MSQSLEAFREETRQWLEENCPQSMRTPMPENERPWGGRVQSHINPDTPVWMQRMIDKGWAAPDWPVEYGGGGLTPEQAIILEEEMERINARMPLACMGIMMLGPVLLECGTEEQKRQFLPDMAKGRIRWSQGFSEPGSGSDLASLKTKAEIHGDHMIINGSKIWTTSADKSDWIFCLVRTSNEGRPQQGITFVLFDLESEGVDRRPIKLISGGADFCQTFFDDVKVPVTNIVGGLNKGWSVAKRLLEFERQNTGKAFLSPGRELDLVEVANNYADGAVNPDLRSRLSHHLMRVEGLNTFLEGLEEQGHTSGASQLAPVYKVLMANNNKIRGELIVEMMGSAGLGWEGSGFSDFELTETRRWLRGKANSIEGGSSEINLNVIAKGLLGLPKARAGGAK
jgi:alkylation response protein AidB-like acyl-CoA dehydrogenase